MPLGWRMSRSRRFQETRKHTRERSTSVPSRLQSIASFCHVSEALSYFEKVTSTRRFANAYLRDEAMLSKDGDQEMRGLSGLVALFLHESPPSLSKRRVGCSAPRM